MSEVTWSKYRLLYPLLQARCSPSCLTGPLFCCSPAARAWRGEGRGGQGRGAVTDSPQGSRRGCTSCRGEPKLHIILLVCLAGARRAGKQPAPQEGGKLPCSSMAGVSAPPCTARAWGGKGGGNCAPSLSLKANALLNHFSILTKLPTQAEHMRPFRCSQY